jgi:magnesium transporter
MVEILGPQNLEDPVSKHLRHDYTPMQVDLTVGEALAVLRSQQIAEKIIYFYVVDREGKLKGVLPTRRLLMSQPEQPIRSIMVDNVLAIPASATVLTACEFFILHRFLAFPVVDEEGRLIGVIDVNLFTDEVFSMAQKRSAESAFQIIGVHVALGRHVSPWLSFRDRFPWLLCNIGGGIAMAFLASHFEPLLDAVVVIALFIPVVLALSESVSIQSMTLTMQMLQRERVDWRILRGSLRKEFFTAGLLGLASGGLVAGVSWLWLGQTPLAGIIGASITLAMVTACLLGVLVPVAVRAVRGDPKIAAGPMVLAMADMATLLFYFYIAQSLLA